MGHANPGSPHTRVILWSAKAFEIAQFPGCFQVFWQYWSVPAVPQRTLCGCWLFEGDVPHNVVVGLIVGSNRQHDAPLRRQSGHVRV